jgi:tetratricopeptide (TPR) repeat protein
MEAGKELLVEGNYAAAISQFLQATTVSEGSDADDAKFYLASAYALNGDARNALVSLAALSPTGEEEWAKDYPLLKAKLLEDTFAFSLAVDVLLKQGSDLAADSARAPTWLFLLALGYKGTGDLAREKACLDKVVSLAPESELSAAAARLLSAQRDTR